MNKEYVICDKTELVAVADAIREKTGSTDDLTVSGLASAVSGIEAGGSGGVAVPEMCTVSFKYNSITVGGFDLATFDIEYIGLDESGNVVRKYESNPESIQCIGYFYCYLSGQNCQINDTQFLDSNGDTDLEAYYCPYGSVGEEIMVLIYKDCHVVFSYSAQSWM
jgi:hypothetical protein